MNDHRTDIKILSFNIHKGFNWNNQRYILEKLRYMIRQENADIVFLQEVIGENNQHHHITEAQFEYLADELWQYYSYGKNAVYPHGHHGNAILSKFPIVQSHNEDISTHRFEQRGILHCEIIIPDYQQLHIHLFCTHLNIVFQRKKQLRKITSFMSPYFHSGQPMILAGDFNDWDNLASSHLTQIYQLTEVFGRGHKTFPSFFPLIKLDNIYVRHFNVIRSFTHHDAPWHFWSDHSALITHISLPP